ncbi:unnamed protein product, partial [Hapterophycus canaliculatus]
QQQSGKGQLSAIKGRRKRPRSNPRNQGDGVDDHQVSPKAAPRQAALQLGHDQNCSRISGIGYQAQLSKANDRCTSPGATVTTVACSVTAETINCTASIGSRAAVVSKPVRSGREQIRRRKSKRNAGLKPVQPSRTTRRPKGTRDGVSSLSQRELNRQMRLLTPGEQGAINRVLETLAAQIDGKSMRTRDLFNLMDSNRDNVLTRAEMEHALAKRGLSITGEQLTHLMAFFDVQGCGYVTLGDLHDSLQVFRAVCQRAHIDEQTATSACPPRLSRTKQRPLRDSATVPRVQPALLAPVVLFTRPSPVEGQGIPVEGQGKRQRSNPAREKRILEQEAGISYLDITNEEICSLADCLMGARDTEVNKKVGFCDENTLAPADQAPRCCANHSKAWRPLLLVMSTLESAAAQASKSQKLNEEQTESVRGPGEAAIPSSAARVLRILRSLQKVWRRKDRRRRAKTFVQREPDHFTHKTLSAAVDLFDVDGRGHVDLEDVITVFRSVRVGKFSSRRPPAAAIPSLAALGSYLHNRGITAQAFVEEAALFAGTDAGSGSLESCGYAGGTKPRAATTAQIRALLRADARLSADQCEVVVGCVEEGGFVSGTNLAGFVRQARRELAHLHLKRRERERTGVGDGGVERSETESQMSEVTGGASSTNSPTKHRTELRERAVEKGEIVAPPPFKHRCRQAEPLAQCAFNQSDASLVLALFVKERGGLRSLTGGTAAALWRGLKRRGYGVHAYEAGRSASRHVRRLLRLRGVKPLEWFRTLDAATQAPASRDAGVPVVRRATMSSIIQGVRALVETENATYVAEIGTTAAAADDDDSVVTSLEGSVSSNGDDGMDKTERAKTNALRWSKPQFAALARHLDPCGVGSITQTSFLEGLNDCRKDRGIYPDAVQLAAAGRFEAALRVVGCEDVCTLFEALASEGRGGGDLVEFVRRMGDCIPSAAHRLDAAARQDRVARVMALRENEARRMRAHKRALLDRVALPENAGALTTIQKLDELMVLQGRRLVAEFHHADASKSGGVSRAELKQALENLVQPCSLLRFKRKQRRERQEEAAAAAQREESWKEEFVRKMEALEKSQASHFLEVVSAELRSRRWKISDIFRDVDKAKSGALGVDDLLENTHRTLGLTLKRNDAAALVSMLDADGDNSIQCEELELALRLYRRYGWERARWARRKPFHEEFPSLSCLFRRAPSTSVTIEAEAMDLQQHRHQERLPALSRSTKICRQDIVVALKRLRGDSDNGVTVGNKHGTGQLLPANGANARRRRVLLRAVRKVARCCQAAGVRTAPALAATLAFFDFGPADRGRSKAGLMRTVDLWHWLRMLSVPKDPGSGCAGGGGGGGGGGGKGAASFNDECNKSNGSVRRQRAASFARYRKNNSNNGRGLGDGVGGGDKVDGGMVSGRLLDSEETSLLLDAVERRPAVGAAGNSATALAATPGVTENGFFVSVPEFWNLLVEHVPGLWDWDLQAKLDAAEVWR